MTYSGKYSMTYCPDCKLVSPSCNNECTKCGGDMEKVPICNQCGEDILPHHSRCISCHTPREKAID